MVEQALQCLQEADTFSAIEFLNQQPRPLVVAAAYNDLLKALYWEQRNIAHVTVIGRAAIQYCSDQAQAAAEAGDMEKAHTLRSAAKQLAYNLASFTWPGWNEPEIDLQPPQIEAGLDAARQNLRLALELDKGDLPLSRAYWMLGGHLLAAKALAGAESNYRRAAMYGRRAESEVDTLLAQAFAALAALLAQPESKAGQTAYAVAAERLSGLEDGEAFQEQLETARSVFADQR